MAEVSRIRTLYEYVFGQDFSCAFSITWQAVFICLINFKREEKKASETQLLIAAIIRESFKKFLHFI